MSCKLGKRSSPSLQLGDANNSVIQVELPSLLFLHEADYASSFIYSSAYFFPWCGLEMRSAVLNIPPFRDKCCCQSSPSSISQVLRQPPMDISLVKMSIRPTAKAMVDFSIYTSAALNHTCIVHYIQNCIIQNLAFICGIVQATSDKEYS